MGPISLSTIVINAFSVIRKTNRNTLPGIEAMGEVIYLFLKENTKKRCRELFVPKYFNC